jgi:hypothetical protein
VRTAQVLRDMEIQRKVGLCDGAAETSDRFRGTTGAELKQQRELYNMLMTAPGCSPSKQESDETWHVALSRPRPSPR